MPTYKEFDRDFLFELYVNQRLSSYQIAKRLNTTAVKISRALKYFNINAPQSECA